MLVKKTLIIQNKQGLHARPAALFVQMANKFDCSVTLKKGNQKVNGKSIMGILTLGADKGSKISIVTKGEDAERAMKEFERLLSEQLENEIKSAPRTKLITSKDKLSKNISFRDRGFTRC